MRFFARHISKETKFRLFIANRSHEYCKILATTKVLFMVMLLIDEWTRIIVGTIILLDLEKRKKAGRW